jgi:hypothetical protein
MERDQEEHRFAFETDVHSQIVDDSTDFDERNQTLKPEKEQFRYDRFHVEFRHGLRAGRFTTSTICVEGFVHETVWTIGVGLRLLLFANLRGF